MQLIILAPNNVKVYINCISIDDNMYKDLSNDIIFNKASPLASIVISTLLNLDRNCVL
jgi:hypothetical protein